VVRRTAIFDINVPPDASFFSKRIGGTPAKRESDVSGSAAAPEAGRVMMENEISRYILLLLLLLPSLFACGM